MKRLVAVSAFLLAARLFTLNAAAAPTKVVVHVMAHDAKIIGTHVGGARVTIRDAETHRVLAEGVQMGETGDTKKIMKEPRVRGESILTTEGAAAFTATLELARPTRVEITAEGPLKYPQALRRVSTTMDLLPGQDMSGDGVVLELYGLVIDLIEPAGTTATAGDLGMKLKLTMMCGCPIEPGGIWDADKMRVMVSLRPRRGAAREVRAVYAGTTSTFTATIPSVAAGTYSLEITASDPQSANFGRFEQKLKVR